MLPWHFVPLQTARGRPGVIGIAQSKNLALLDSEERALLETLTEQATAALDFFSILLERSAGEDAPKTDPIARSRYRCQ
jgi:two-component system, OmpR family, sensor histidine kinase KdpD